MATIIPEILLIFVLTTDSFVVSFAYGMRKVKMPFKIVAGMNIIMSGLLGISLLTGSFLSDFLPKDVTTCLGAILLIGIGLYRILSFFFQKEENKEIYQELTAAEGFTLAFLLSLDSLAVGVGAGLVQSGQLFLAAGTFICGILMMELGWRLGCVFRNTTQKDLSWVSGVCLLLLAMSFLWKR